MGIAIPLAGCVMSQYTNHIRGSRQEQIATGGKDSVHSPVLEEMKKCKKESCEEEYYKHEYCSKHYEEIFVGICRIADCRRGKYKDGKCYNHWAGINRAVEYETVADYEIVETKFIGTRSNNRMMYKIVVEPTITREQIKPTARKIIKVITSKDKDLDEITLFLYSDKSVIGEPYDIASVDWGYPENEGRIKLFILDNKLAI